MPRAPGLPAVCSTEIRLTRGATCAWPLIIFRFNAYAFTATGKADFKFRGNRCCLTNVLVQTGLQLQGREILLGIRATF